MKNSWIRVVYFYLFALVGLTLMIIGGVKLVDLGLKLTVFPQADRDLYGYERQPVMPPFAYDNIKSLTGKTDLEEIQKAQIEAWLVDYQNWKENQTKIDPMTARRQRDASIALAMIIIGLPLFLFHFRTIKKEKIGLNG